MSHFNETKQTKTKKLNNNGNKKNVLVNIRGFVFRLSRNEYKEFLENLPEWSN